MTSTAPASTDKKAGDRAALIELIGGYMTAHALGLAAELKLADHIGDSTRTSTELAEATGTHEPSLHRLLRTLAAVGVTTEPEPGRFSLTEVGAQLRTDSPDSLHAFTRMFCDPTLFTAWQELGRVVRTGEPSFAHVHGKDIYGYLADHPELSALFNEAMGQESRISADRIAAAHDFSGVEHVVDLGGGDGTLLAAILGANPHLRGTVVDSPSGVAQAAEVLGAAGVADRCEVVAGDFFQSVPADGDLYIIKSVFQDWDDEPARAILRTCRAHMPDTATLLIIGSVLPETASAETVSAETRIMFYTDVNMMVTSGGRERTESDFRTMLADTGFTVESVAHAAAGPLSIIRATPAS
ncbi:methyltransferase [Saccharothrix texasensis]|uniref:IclR-like helix-turn-helix domain-containing protein n=1 Tax=Saccharothrix texasensis TaxID=103734 RepID=A0A3N1H445_9PSEU|nr:methyltransferase [Saccharothrix texasensis]ROP37268.1 IclR-like helix-turn-helix domain-containing protein [Saccharothrix texasensis]